MKEVLSAFSTEFFRPLITLLLPGGIAIGPYFIALMLKWPRFYGMVDANHTESALVLFLIALFVGLVIEDLGGRFEANVLDEKEKRTSKDFEDVWWKYLTNTFDDKLPGRRYLSALVMRLKFELGASIALLLVVPGLWFVNVPDRLSCLMSFGAIVLSIYLGGFEAPSTHRLLRSSRAAS